MDRIGILFRTIRRRGVKAAFIVPALLLMLAAAGSARAAAADEPREHLSLDLNWRFSKGDPPDAQKSEFDDSAWRELDVPHDWSIEGPYDEKNTTGPTGGYLPAGIAWYRRHFVTQDDFTGRRVSVQFDGVYMNATVYLNGHRIGQHDYGYTSFVCDLTPFLAPARGGNVLAVRVDNSTQPNSRYYSGSGIYRHVWMDVTGPVHIPVWGTVVRTLEVSATGAAIGIQTEVENDGGSSTTAKIRQELVDAGGQIVGRNEKSVRLPAKGQREIEQVISVSQPKLWAPDHPALYAVRTSVTRAGEGSAAELLDTVETTTGIRHIEFDADRGLLINGQHIKMLGMCLHEDGGAVGAAVPIEVWERRLQLLKAMGCNAIRCAHNPFAPEFLDLCDRLGFLVMDESFDEWTSPKGKLHGSYADYFRADAEADLHSMLQRDRNHPSIVLWSIGNEIPDQSSAGGVAIARRLTAICHAEDPTRAVTSACDRVHAPKGATMPGFLAALDVAGYNYIDRWGPFRELYYSEDRSAHPGFKFVGTEDAGYGGVRGSYFGGNVPTVGGFQSLPYPSRTIRAEQLWKFVALHDYVAGYFTWLGIDYLGEAGAWPRKGGTSGVLDTCGFPKDSYYFYQSLWTQKPMVHLLPDWNYPGKEGTILPVVVYSNCPEVELFLNGKSYGVKSLVFPRPGAVHAWNDRTPVGTTADLHLSWDVPYESGTLRAVGRQDGKDVAETEIHTAGAPATIALNCASTACVGRGVEQIEVRILDGDGNPARDANNMITFSVQGPARIIGLDNGDQSSHDSYQGETRPAFNGEALAIVQAQNESGHVIVTAKAEGLKPASVEFDVTASAGVAGVASLP
jgi:beta-galactosidase